jgi:hypothetical protein
MLHKLLIEHLINMKTLFLLLISFSAFAQIDTTEGRYWFIPGNLQPAAEPEYNVFKLKFRKLTDTVVFTDFSRAYAMEINIDGMNRPGSKARVLSMSIPTNAELTTTERNQIEDLIVQLANAGTSVTTEKVDASLMTFSGGWQRSGTTTDTTWFNKTIAYSTVPNSSALYNFNGKRIEVWGERKAGHGTGSIIVDGVAHTAHWNIEPFGLPVLIFAKDLPDGDHVIEVKPDSGTVLIDFLVRKK